MLRLPDPSSSTGTATTSDHATDIAKFTSNVNADAADAAIKSVAEKMKGEHNKSRVTFYYLLAEATGTLAKLGK